MPVICRVDQAARVLFRVMTAVIFLTVFLMLSKSAEPRCCFLLIGMGCVVENDGLDE
jgi:hypothetical protein